MSDLPLRVALQSTLQGLLLDLRANELVESDALPHDDVTSLPHLIWMANHALAHFMEWPCDKTSRWIGYVQGVMTCRDIMDPAVERDRTRPFFHKAYEAMGFNIPKTTERE